MWLVGLVPFRVNFNCDDHTRDYIGSGSPVGLMEEWVSTCTRKERKGRKPKIDKHVTAGSVIPGCQAKSKHQEITT